MIIINGIESPNAKEKSVLDYLNEHGFNKDRVVVEINEVIIPKENFNTKIIADGDTVEILNFVGGG